MLVEFHPAASQELESASSFYEGRRPGLGEELADEIEEVCLLLSEYPPLAGRWMISTAAFHSEDSRSFCSTEFVERWCKS